jgi:uncharacterized protein YjbJ (UPF0337 family)
MMNWDQLTGEWKQMEAHVKSKWAKLTDDDLKNLGAKKDLLVGKIQERYGILKEEAEHQVDDWMAKLSPKPAQTPDTRSTNGESRPAKDTQPSKRA